MPKTRTRTTVIPATPNAPSPLPIMEKTAVGEMSEIKMVLPSAAPLAAIS